jgi:hypothetical protein
MQKLLTLLIRGYRYLISPLLGNHCRFYPTCSHYALDAIEHHGALKGTWLAGARLLRCHPWPPGGYDPVPLPKQKNGTHTEHG